MDRAQKEAFVAELAQELGDSQAIFAVDYRGISVPQAAELRAELRDADTQFRIVKNRLTLRAADAAGTAELKNWLEGPTALALVKGDAAMAAKTLTKLGGEFEVLDYKGGLMDGNVLEPDEFKAIAKLPGRDQMNAQLLGMVASPITGLVRGLGSMVQGLALQLGQIAEQGLVTGEAPAEEAPAEEAPAEEAPAEEAPAEAAPAEEEAPAEEAPAEEEKPAEEEEPAAEEKTEEPEATAEEAPEQETEPEAEEPEGQTETPDTPAGEAEDVAGDESKEDDQ
jgi:large subunit ribosomal protein L10